MNFIIFFLLMILFFNVADRVNSRWISSSSGKVVKKKRNPVFEFRLILGLFICWSIICISMFFYIRSEESKDGEKYFLLYFVALVWGGVVYRRIYIAWKDFLSVRGKLWKP